MSVLKSGSQYWMISPVETVDDIWMWIWLSPLCREGLLLTPNGLRARMLLNILQCMGKTVSDNKNCPLIGFRDKMMTFWIRVQL